MSIRSPTIASLRQPTAEGIVIHTRLNNFGQVRTAFGASTGPPVKVVVVCTSNRSRWLEHLANNRRHVRC